MLVDPDLLLKYGGFAENYAPSEIIFSEGEIPHYYYQLVTGLVKLSHFAEDDKEMIQSIVFEGKSVCELLSFTDQKFPVNAVAMVPSIVIKVPKAGFLKLISENQQSAVATQRYVAERLYHKFRLMQNNASKYSHVRIKGILTYFKSLSEDKTPYSYEVQLTRKQLAALTGLRIETVIRTVKKMESEKLLKIIKRKIYF